MRHRGRQAARRTRHPADPRPGPRRPARRAGAALRRRARAIASTRRSRSCTSCRPGVDRGGPRPGRARARRVRPPARHRPRRADPARDAQRPDRDPARGRARRARGHGRRRRRPATPGTSLFGALPEAIAQRAKPTVIVVKTREPIGRQTFEQRAQQAETPGRRRPRRRGVARVPARVDRWFAESNFHHSEFADLAPAAYAQGEAGPDDQRWSCRRSTRRRPSGRSSAAPCARCRSATRSSTSSSSSTPTSTTTPRDRRGRGRPGRPALRRPAALRLVPGQGRGALEEPVRDERRHRRLGGHGHPRLAPALRLRDARAAARRAAAAVRQGLLPAADRRGRRAQGGRRRPRHRARRAAADQPVLPRAVRAHPAARRASTRAAGRCSSRSRSSPAMPSRSATSSTSPSGSGSTASARSTSTSGSTATRSSRACRG